MRNLQRRPDINLGTWITIPAVAVVEILGTAGFEFMVVDMEHSAISISQCSDLIRIIQAQRAKAFVRVSKNEEVVIKQVLDAGADGVIIPMIKNSEELEQAISFVKYPPRGRRGVGLSRAQNYGVGFENYVEWLDKEVTIVAQIEHIDSVNNLESILSTPDLDAIIIGPYDLSGSMGKPGKFDDPEVIEAIETIEKKCLKSNVKLGSHIIPSDAAEVYDRLKKGYSFLAFSIDFLFLGDKARSEMEKVRKYLSS